MTHWLVLYALSVLPALVVLVVMEDTSGGTSLKYPARMILMAACWPLVVIGGCVAAAEAFTEWVGRR